MEPGCPRRRSSERKLSPADGHEHRREELPGRRLPERPGTDGRGVLGFHRGWQPAGYAPTATLAIQKVVKAIKARNPRILVGQYTILSVAYDDPNNAVDQDKRDKLHASNWWLLNVAGRKVQWTSQYRTWEVNLTTWSQADANGERWPQWLAEREHAVFFRDIPEFDIVYLDDVGAPRVTADWNLDGKDDDRNDAGILAAH